MRRRDVLAATGTAGLAALAGCSALQSLTSQSCESAANSLGDVSIDRDDHEYEYTNLTTETYDVRGTVVYVDDIEGLWIRDGTGLGHVSSAKTGKVIDPSAFSAGDCVSASGRLNVYQSEAHEAPSISAAQLSNEGSAGGSDGPTDFEVPSPRFEVEWEDTREPMRFTLTEGEVAAGDLVVRHQEHDGRTPWPEAAHDTWADLAGLSSDEQIPAGSTLEFDGGAGLSVLYAHPDSEFTKQVGGEVGGPDPIDA